MCQECGVTGGMWFCVSGRDVAFAGGEDCGDQEGQDDSAGGGEKCGRVAVMGDDGSGSGAGDEEGKIHEDVVSAEGGAAVFRGDVANSFNPQRRKDQGKAETDECGGEEGGGAAVRECQKSEAGGFNDEG